MVFPGFTPSLDEDECRATLELAMLLLGRRADLTGILRIDPEPAKDLPGKSNSPRNLFTFWNVFRFRGRSKTDPHLTLGVGSNVDVSAMVTLPNAAKGAAWTRLQRRDFRSLTAEVLMKMRPVMSNCPGMEPRMRFRQRHFRPQLGVKGRAAFHDAYLDVDLRTLSGDPDEGVKAQSEWIDAAFRVLTNKNSNLELQIGAVFPYTRCIAMRDSDALDHVAAAWIGCRPFIERLGVVGP